MPEDKNYKKILELNEDYGCLAEENAWRKKQLEWHKKEIKLNEQQMDRLKKEISELSSVDAP